MELPGKRKWGRPKRRFMDAEKKGMGVVEVSEKDADDNYNNSKLRWKIRCNDPCRERSKEEE